MSHVFLSYDHDNHHFADQVTDKLEGKNIKIWQDIHDLRGGDRWADEIDKAISDAYAIIVILTPESEVSSFVTYEWSFAMGKSKLVIPLLFQKCETIHPKLEQFQYLDFSVRFNKPWERLIQRLQDQIQFQLEELDQNKLAVEPEPIITGELVDPNAPIIPSWAKGDHGKDQYGYWAAFTFKGINHKFRWIPPGEFMMGSPDTEEGRYDDEVLHPVYIKEGFWLGEFPVTQALYQAVVGKNPSYFSDAENSSLLPVEEVNWLEAISFTEELNNQISGLNSTLPLESLWEYACRAGSSTAFSFGDKISSERANYQRNVVSTTEKGRYPVNPWGLYDMHGNVWEWCLDIFKDDLGSRSVQVTTGEALEKIRIKSIKSVNQNQSTAMALRGGGWAYDGLSCRSAIRYRRGADSRGQSIGFRLSLGPVEK